MNTFESLYFQVFEYVYSYCPDLHNLYSIKAAH